MTELTKDINQMRIELGDLVKPGWNDSQVSQLYRLLMDSSSLPIVINLAAAGLLLGKLDQNYWKPSDRNVI